VRFGNDGSGQASFAQEPDTVSGIELLANGNVLVTGNAAYDNGGGFAYAAFTSSGALDPRFGAYPAATVSGHLTAVDGDAGDSAHWGGSATGAYGSFAIAVDGSWTYTLDPSNAAALSLAPGATLTEDFLATVTDSFGAHADCHVLVTIVGTPAS
jgi:VCBS repeat-containing protein